MKHRKKLTDAEQVHAYMAELEHSLKPLIEALRVIIKNADPRISERIKWNAPSYYFHKDIVTFGPPARKASEIMLVFHHPAIVHISSELLEGNYKDRRLAIFKNMDEVEAGHEELVKILNRIVSEIEMEA
ncbi:MAG: DUF1801 domain-containing protein [Saprospiraceae bacterium]